MRYSEAVDTLSTLNTPFGTCYSSYCMMFSVVVHLLDTVLTGI